MKLLVLFLLSASIESINMSASYRPATVVQAEGLEAEFLCQHPTDLGTIDWTIGGVRLRDIDTSDGSIRTEGRGAAVEVLIIRALARFNRTEIVCIIYSRQEGTTNLDVEYTQPARLIVQGHLGMISDLKVNSTSSMIHLNWKAPFSLNLSAVDPDIVYCLDIFKVFDLELSRDHLVSNCSVFETHYNFGINQDPRALLQFSVTPKSNVEGARNGTPTNTYLFDEPGSLLEEDITVDVAVDSQDNVAVVIHLQNIHEISGSRRPTMYKVTVVSIANDKVHTCPVEIHPDEENTMLILNCTDIIQPKRLYKFNITGSNPAGTSTIIQDVPLSTHYVQDINTTSSTLIPGQVDISCEFLVNNTKTLGYVALVYDGEDVNYLVTENTHQGVVTNHLQVLGGENYSTLLYAINESGLPLEQAAGFPTNISIIGNHQTQGNPNDTHDSVSATISCSNSQWCLIECAFSENSTASGCIAVYWKDEPDLYGLVNFSTSKLDRNEGVASEIINMANREEESRRYHVAVFAYSNNMISGEPLDKVYTGTGVRAGTPKQQQTALIAALISIIIITVSLVAVTVGAAIVCVHLKRRKLNTNECGQSTEQGDKMDTDKNFKVLN